MYAKQSGLDRIDVWAVEYMLCDLEKSVGGQLDLLGYDNKSQKLMLIDLKTQSQKYAKP